MVNKHELLHSYDKSIDNMEDNYSASNSAILNLNFPKIHQFSLNEMHVDTI